MIDVPLACCCGVVRGVARDVSARSGTRVICYCHDCQAFAGYLGREDMVLDEYGGTDIFQMTPSQLTLTAGADQVRCLRLSEKGMYRWYSDCCKTPIANSLSAGVPFVGMIHSIMDDDGVRDQNLGPVRGQVFTQFAKTALPGERRQAGSMLRIMLRNIFKLLVWKLLGKHKPSPFFDMSGQPVSEPEILSSVS